jgi:histidine triad (HIT) family protein
MTIFEKIINGEIPAFKVAETDLYLAFLDINPLSQGHTLCIPKKSVDNLFDLEDDLYIGLQLFTKKVAKALKACVDCERIGVSVIGLEVPHAHIHLIPLNEVRDMDFSRSKGSLDPETSEALAKQIRAHFEQL